MHHILTIITITLIIHSTLSQKSWSNQVPNDPFHSNDWVPLPSATFQQQVIHPNVPVRQSAGRSINFGSVNSQQYTGPQIFPGHNVDQQQQQSLFSDKSPDIITKPPALDTGGEGRSILVSSNFHFGTNIQQQQQQQSSPNLLSRENVIQQPSFLENQFYQPLNPLAFQHFEQQPQPQHVHNHQRPASATIVEEPKPEMFNPFAYQHPVSPGPSVIPQSQGEEVQLLYVPLDTLWQHKLQQQQQQPQQILHQRPSPSTRNFIDPVQINNFYTPQPYTTTTTKPTTTTTKPSPVVYNRFSITSKPQYFSSNKPSSQQFSQSPNAIYSTHSPTYQTTATPRYIQTTTSQPSLGSYGNNYFNQPSMQSLTTPRTQTKKSNQPPLSMFVRNGLSSSDISVADVLATLKNLNSVDVLDSPGKKSPKVFIGPSNLFTPNGYSKFSLPYLSTIEHSQSPSSSSNGSLQHIPFFVAPQSYRAPKGFAKIPLPAPHIGSFVHSAVDSYGIEKTSRRPVSQPNVEVNIGSTRYSSIPTEQPSYTKSYRGSSSSTTSPVPSTTVNEFFDFEENPERFSRPNAEKSIRFRNNPNSFKFPSHIQNEEYFNVKSTPNYVSSSTPSTAEANENDANLSSTLSYTKNPHIPNYFHYDSYNNNSKVPALRLQNYNPAISQSERPVVFRPSPKSEHDEPDLFRPMTEQPPSPSPQEEYEMKNYFRGQTEFRTPFNDISSTPSYDRVSSTESNEIQKFESPVYTESNYISETPIPEITTKKTIYFPPAATTNEQGTFPLNHNEVYRPRNITRSSRPVSRFRYQYSTETPIQQQTTKSHRDKTENRNYSDNQYATNFASILNPIMNYFTSDGINEEKTETTTTSVLPSIEHSEELIELPKELPAINARLPGMINNLLEEELALAELSGSSTTESYTTSTEPTTPPVVIRRRPGSRRTVPVRTTTPSTERSNTRQTTPRGRRTYGHTTSSSTTNDGTTRTRNSPIRSRNVTGINRGSTRARGTVKAKDKKEENWEYQRDELNQNYPSTKIRKVTSNRGETVTTTTTATPITITPTQIPLTKKPSVDHDDSNSSNDFLSGVPLQLPEKYQSTKQIPNNSPVYEAQRTTMKAQSLNNELIENTPKPIIRRYNFANRSARPSTTEATATVKPVEITERIDTTQWNENYVGLDTTQPEFSTEQPKKTKTRNKRIRKPSSGRISATTTTESSNAQRFTNDDIHRQINQFNAGFYSETPQQPTRSSTYKYSNNEQHPYSKFFKSSTEDAISTAAIYSSNKRHDNSIIIGDSTDSPTSPTNRRRGVWKRIRVRPIDVLETAESQYIEKTNFSPKQNDSNVNNKFNNTELSSKDKFEDSQLYTNQVLETNDNQPAYDLNYESQKLTESQQPVDNINDIQTIETTTIKDDLEYSTIHSDDHDIITTTNGDIKFDEITEQSTTIETIKDDILVTTSTEHPELQATTIYQNSDVLEQRNENEDTEMLHKDDMVFEATKNEGILQANDPVIESPSTTINYAINEPTILTTEQPMKYYFHNDGSDDDYDEEMVTEESEIHQIQSNNDNDNDEIELENIEDENDLANIIASSLDENPTKQYMTIKRQKPSTSENTSEESNNSTTNNDQFDPNNAIAFHKNLMKSVIYATSTSTRVTHDTEICYRGRCIRTDKKS